MLCLCHPIRVSRPRTDHYGGVERWDHTHTDDVNTANHWDRIHRWDTMGAARSGAVTGDNIAPDGACDRSDTGEGTGTGTGTGTDCLPTEDGNGVGGTADEDGNGGSVGGSADGSADISTPRTVAGFDAVLGRLFRRIDTASGPYQMISVLGTTVPDRVVCIPARYCVLIDVLLVLLSNWDGVLVHIGAALCQVTASCSGARLPTNHARSARSTPRTSRSSRSTTSITRYHN